VSLQQRFDASAQFRVALARLLDEGQPLIWWVTIDGCQENSLCV
jgi:hypothetical protein